MQRTEGNIEHELKGAIKSYLSQVDVDARLQQALAGGYTKAAVENDLLGDLEQSGFIDELIDEFNINSDMKRRKKLPETRAHPNINYLRRQLLVQVHTGKAFTSHLLDQPTLPGHTPPTYTLHLSFRGQRFRSQPTPCSDEPNIRESFLLELHLNDNKDKMLDVTELLSIGDKIHMVLVKTDPNSDTHLISSQYLEYRTVLSSPTGKRSLSVEMMGIGTESSISVGIIELTMSIIPQPDVLPPEVIEEQLKMEKSYQAERDRLFLVYTKQWWREFLQIRPLHSSRLVKLYAQDENQVNRPVCSYVQPLRCGRLLENPRQAARFVSLIKYNKPAVVGSGERTEQWCSLHSLLAANRGDVENHACLLASILLGYGLNAYVCLGTKNKSSPHAWVVTIGPEDGAVTFWESLSSNRYIHKAPTVNGMLLNPPPTPKHPYRTVGCVFNHKSFYANVQTSDEVTFADFDLENTGLWKSMTTDAISSVCSPSVSWMAMPPLQRPLYDASTESNKMEIELRHMVSEYREGEGLSTAFDDQCSYMLSMALSAYETERITGQPFGNEEFSQSVTYSIPEGHTFKAYPIHFPYVNARRSFAAVIKSKTCSDVLLCRGDHVKLAVRVCVYPYPESAVATWIMFACRYQSIM
ncbi:centrosomal protein of 76 kDa-like isoform X2 [Watersipora subatra]|uniref:centrosomal protein of 76 kDa-like isoform X2 n=1 Tax=Watersipora subatra TaxID=2589382 RepID=UPI00355B7B40